MSLMAVHKSKLGRIALCIGQSTGACVTDHCKMLPSFFIIGPPRTGTSWLHEILRKYTLLPKTKETRFFDLNFHRGINWYRANYPKMNGEQSMGEVAPTYFASAETRERIAQTIPNARVVCTFRNPIDRVHSHYRLKRAYAMIPWSFEEAMTRDSELAESSKYATHLKAWQQTFGANNVLAMVYDDLLLSPQSFVDRVTDFIGIQRFVLTDSQIHYVHASHAFTEPRNYYRTRGAIAMADWFKARQFGEFVAAVKRSRLQKWVLGGGPSFAKVPPEALRDLCERFRPEVEELETMLGREFADWKSVEPRVLATA